MRISLLLIFIVAKAEGCIRVSPPTPGMPATPCKTCAANLITVKTDGEGAKPMDGDSIVTTGACSQRMFTCKGIDATIEYFGPDGGSLGMSEDGGTGTATYTVTCSADGTKWEANGITISAVECAVVPACKDCDPALVTVILDGPDSAPMGDNTVDDSGCAVRTFTCMGPDPMINVVSMAGPQPPVDDGGTGTATLVVTCNAAGTGWVANGQTITSVECIATPKCKTCTMDQLMVTELGLDAKMMESDMTVMTGACSERTFTCMGTDAKITPSAGAPITDGGTGTATYTVTCNAHGTGWTFGGQVITTVECSATPPCKMCAENAITVTDNVGVDAKPMDDDMTVMDGECSERTFACLGTDAKITPSSGAPITDGGTGQATYTVTCNADGTGWTFGGQIITTVQCSATPPCKMCTMDQLMVTELGLDAKEMDNDMTVMNGVCSERTFTCMGTDAKITPSTGAPVTDGGTGTATYTVTCNADGTGWTFGGQVITTVECSATPACKMCTMDQLMVTELGLDAKEMDDDMTVMNGVCSERTFTCMGTDAKITPSMGAVVTDGGTGTATYTVTCNADGTGWTFGGQVITTVECSATPACKMCTMDQLMVTELGLDAKEMDNDMTVMNGVCSERTFTCMGTDAKITPSMGAVVTDGGTGTATYTVTCNADGTGWTFGGQVITTVECSATPACKMCTMDQLMVTELGLDAKEMDNDMTVMNGVCSERTFTCMGTDAKITPSMGAVVTDGGTGTATYTVTCNADGTGWTFGGQVITTVECSATPACKMCTMDQLMVTELGLDAKMMESDMTVMNGVCSERTFTCEGTDAKITPSMGAVVTDGGTGTATYTVTCNADGTGWTFGGQVITTVECSATPPCKMCAANLIAITQNGEISKPFADDQTVNTGVCSERTFTCKGNSAAIDLFENGVMVGTIPDDDNNEVTTLTVTCSADGTGWFFGAQKITGVECSAIPECLLCDPAAITKTQVDANSQMFAKDETTFMGCAMRKFTCMGVEAKITGMSTAGPITPVTDGGTGTATYTVTCNANKMWQAGGQTITSVECVVAVPCKRCAANLITITSDGLGGKAMDGDVTSTAGACATRTFTCNAAVNPTIEMNGGAVKVADAADGATDGSAKLVATCNAAGTAWELNGVAVTQVKCTVPCKTCAADVIAVSTGGDGGTGMVISTPADIDRSGTCAMWTLKCTGVMFPNWDINMGLGSWSDVEDGVPDNIVMFPMTCNEFGTRWSAFMTDITSMVCDASGVAPG